MLEFLLNVVNPPLDKKGRFDPLRWTKWSLKFMFGAFVSWGLNLTNRSILGSGRARVWLQEHLSACIAGR